MRKFHPAIVLGIAAVTLASCSKSRPEPIAPIDQAAAEPAREADEGSIVLTGSRVAGSAAKTESRADATALYAPPAPPPPVMVSGSRMARPNLPWSPPDVGRDRFTSVSENPFRVVTQEPVSTFSIDVDTAS